MKKILITLAVLGLAACTSACTDAPGAERAVRAYGMSDIQITGHRFTGCGESDDTSTGFTAIDRGGNRVSGVVCGNWSPFGKSNTVRID